MSVVSTIQPFSLVIFDPVGYAEVKTTTQVEILQGEFLHDTAVVTLRGANMSDPTLQPGVVVSIGYGWYHFQVEQFYGYIDHIESHYQRLTSDAAEYHDVVCIGASYVLKDPYVGSWMSVQASALVQQIAVSYGLSTLVEVDDTTWPQLSAPGDSAWTFLVTMAQKLGFTFACNKTLLRFTSVDLAMVQNVNTMSVFNSANSALNANYETIMSFSALQGEATGINGTRAVRQAGGIDLRTGQMVLITDDTTSIRPIAASVPPPFFTMQESDLVISDQFQGQAALAGVQQQNRFHYLAEAKLTGDTSVVQGVPIVLSGLGEKDNGIWWVQEVCHHFEYAVYYMTVKLGRDSSYDIGYRPAGTSHVAYSPNNPLSQAMNSVPPTRLVLNKWRAAYSSNTQVVNQ